MKILWLVNYPLSGIAEQLNRGKTVKEGWVESLCRELLQTRKDAELVIVFPLSNGEQVHGECENDYGRMEYYSFYENIAKSEIYDENLETELKDIVDQVNPDLVHIFGAEFPHSLAMAKVVGNPKKVLIGIQGVCTEIAKTYYADLPKSVINIPSLRDILKRDGIKEQKQKFIMRGNNEREAMKLAGFLAGRTDFDKKFAMSVNPEAKYVKLGENLRPTFYSGEWAEEKCVKHRLFVSQGDYPLKGLHYLLPAMGRLKCEYPDITVHIAGNSIIRQATLKDRLKIGGYGRYILKLVKKYGLSDCMEYMGYLDAEAMKQEYLSCNAFVNISTCENSPNSLGEAMILGVPCIASMVGGVPSVFDREADGIGIDFSIWSVNAENQADNDMDVIKNESNKNNSCDYLTKTSKSIELAIKNVFDNPDSIREKCKNARKHARITHDKTENCRSLIQIYEDMLYLQLY